MDAESMLDFDLSQITQGRLPRAHLMKHVSHRFRNQDMPCVAAIHYTLCQIYSTSSYVSVGVNILDPLNRPRVNPHAQLQIWLLSYGTTDLKSAADRRFRISKKHKGHAVSRWEAEQLTALLCSTELRSIPDDLLEFFYEAGLCIHRRLRVGHDVHEQDVGDLQSALGAGI
jgi:hypothetical protein